MRLLCIIIVLVSWSNNVLLSIRSSDYTWADLQPADQNARVSRPKIYEDTERSIGKRNENNNSGRLMFLSDEASNESEAIKRLRRKMTIRSDQIRPSLEDFIRDFAYQKKEAVEHPYAVLLRVAVTTTAGKPGVHFCSGTLISLSWVLTAGQCFLGSFQPHNVTVLAGLEFADIADPLQHSNWVQIDVSDEWYIHPDCGNDTIHDRDLALVKLPRPFRRTPYTRAIRMSPTPWDQDYHGCSTTSLGLIEKGNKMFRKSNEIQVGKPCSCDPLLRANHGDGPTSRYLCIRPKDDGSCKGNSGGGLVCQNGIAGVFSFFVDFSGVIKTGICDHEVHYESLEKSKMQEILKYQSPKKECGTRYTIGVFQDTHTSLEWIKSTAKLVDSDACRINFNISMLLIATMLTVC